MKICICFAIAGVCLACVASAEAQIGNSEESATLLAMECAASSGYPAEGYMQYARGLALTLSFVNVEAQKEIFGFVPLQGAAQTPVGDLPFSLADSNLAEDPNSGDVPGSGSTSTDSGGSSSGGASGSWWDQFLEWVASLF